MANAMEGLLRIFISYRRSETRGYVGWLSYCLEDEFGRENVFRDVETIGIAQWRTSIDEAIRLADVVLCVMGDQWLTVEKSGIRRLDDPKDMVRFEVGMALRCKAQHNRVVPTLLEDAQMPLPEDLPDELKELPNQNAYRLRYEGWRSDVKDLVEELRTIRPGRPKKLNGAEIAARWERGHDVPNWVGCQGGEKALMRMDNETWRAKDFEVQFGGGKKNANWFSIRTFVTGASGVISSD